MADRRAWRSGGWLALLALVELTGRALAYALAPAPAPGLEGQLGGPGVALVAVIALGLAGALSAGLVALAGMGARERWTLAGNPGRGPRAPVVRVLARMCALWAASTLLFAAIESYLHVRAGLGFHGLACLLGPVHRNAIPLLGALSLLGAAAVTAAGHLLRWMRATLGRAFGVRRLPRPAPARLAPAGASPFPLQWHGTACRPRGPPLVVD
jgi:hypothetical protein